jgi:hypothetical protein
MFPVKINIQKTYKYFFVLVSRGRPERPIHPHRCRPRDRNASFCLLLEADKKSRLFSKFACHSSGRHYKRHEERDLFISQFEGYEEEGEEEFETVSNNRFIHDLRWVFKLNDEYQVDFSSRIDSWYELNRSATDISYFRKVYPCSCSVYHESADPSGISAVLYFPNGLWLPAKVRSPDLMPGDYNLIRNSVSEEAVDTTQDNVWSDAPDLPKTTATNAFRKTSAGFEMYFDSESVDLFPKTVGTRCLHVLLSNLGNEFSTDELHSAVNPPPPGFAEYRDTMEHETLTPDARKRLLADLNDLKEEHRHCTNRDHRDSLADEIRKIEKYLEKSTTGHPRTTERGTQHFRRKGFSHGNYQKRIREAIAKIKRKNKDAGAYLENSITRGTNNVFQYHGERRWQT